MAVLGGGPLAHRDEAEAVATTEPRLGGGDVEALAVVTDHRREAAGLEEEHQLDRGGPAVPDGVGDGILDDPVERDLDPAAHPARCPEDDQLAADGGPEVGEERRLPGNYEAVLFRIIQEALTNIRKHAHARNAEVTLTMQPRKVIALIKDDGEGFDVAATEARLGRTRNLGLISMRERAELEKGDLEIKSAIGQGTEVRITFSF